MASDVAFRRVHGRIVPIKINPQQERNSGEAMIAGGLGLAGVAGFASGKLHGTAIEKLAKSNSFRARARSIYKLAAQTAKGKPKLNRQAGQAVFHAAKNLGSAKSLFRVGATTQIAGQAIGGTMVAQGVHKLLPQKVKNHPTADVLASSGAGLAAAFLVKSNYYKKLGEKLGGMKTFAAIRFAAKKVIKHS